MNDIIFSGGMLSKSHSVSGPAGSGGYSSGGGIKKKKAPPRPPPPSANNVRPSKSFGNSGELQSQRISSFGQRSSYSVEHPGGPSDLIDFSESSNNFQGDVGLKKRKEEDYMYRVGASIFYIRSQLKNPAPSKAGNPFSPPRPSAQAMMASPAKHATSAPQGHHTTSTLYTNVPAQKSHSTNASGSIKYKPTIIKRPNENNNTIKSAIGEGSVRSSSGSSDWSDYSQTSQQQQQQRYGNIPLAWDEPPAQHREPPKTVSNVVIPTIIKPPIASKPSLLPKPTTGSSAAVSLNKAFTDSSAWTSFASKIQMNDDVSHNQQRNYYDDPPDSDFDEDEDHDDSFVSPPMPSEPPPPPPPDIALNEWVDSTAGAPTYVESTYANQGNETDRAYAIVLYDYLSDVDGDLPLQVGDLVYLIKKIDEEWLYGQCAGIEGMFPCNYVNVVVSLPELEMPQPEQNQVQETVPQTDPRSNQVYFADALYLFDAEADGDLSLRPGDMVKIFGRLNEDWLYGEVAGCVGQFPASFVEPVPSDLPVIPTPS